MKIFVGILVLIMASSMNIYSMSLSDSDSSSSGKDPHACSELIHYWAAQKVAQKVFDIAASYDPHDANLITLERSDNFYPDRNQTKCGIFLEIERTGPMSVWLPWGKWQFVKGTSVKYNGDKRLLRDLKAAIQFSECKEIYRNLGGSEKFLISQSYPIEQIDGVLLPLPEEQEKNKYIPYILAQEIWLRLKKQDEPTKNY